MAFDDESAWGTDRADQPSGSPHVPAGRGVPGGEAGATRWEHAAADEAGLRWLVSLGLVLRRSGRPVETRCANIDDGQVSQIDDEEMARMNIEISAGVAWWLTLAGSDGRRYEDRRRLTFFPLAEIVSALQGGDVLLTSTVPEPAELHRQWPADRRTGHADGSKLGIRDHCQYDHSYRGRGGPIGKCPCRAMRGVMD